MSLYNDIRGALVTKLAAVSGIPALADEGDTYSPVVGTPFVEYVNAPSQSRPVTMGGDHLKLHQGIFHVAVVYPTKSGIGAAETMADAIKEAFPVDVSTITQNSITVRIRYAERLGAITQTDWVRIPIEIKWYLYTEAY